MPVKVIDLFAGPGGLGEGFSNCKKGSPFEIAMSVEIESNAHKTLTLRALYRKLTPKERSNYYYPYIQSTTEEEKREKFKILTTKNARKWEQAQYETMGSPHALGNPKKWEKIKNGEPITSEDNKPTKQEKDIFNRIDEITSSHTGPIIVIGGPPCQAYSVNGRNRQKAEKDYKPENDERFFLYQEYLKVLDRADPDIFIMENVEGILSAKLAKGEFIFEKIKRELVRPDRAVNERYDIYSLIVKPQIPATPPSSGPIYQDDHDYVIKASDFGVPQGRKRVILFGIKRKHGSVDMIMSFSKPGKTPNTNELIGQLPKLRSGISKTSEGPDTISQWSKNWKSNKTKLTTILPNSNEIKKVATRWVNIDIKNREHRGQSDFTPQELQKLKKDYINEISDAYERTLSQVKNLELPSFTNKTTGGRGNDYFINMNSETDTFPEEFKNNYKKLYHWICKDNELGGVINHMTRSHMKDDLIRYMFSAAWAKAHSNNHSPSPKSRDFPVSISPKHSNWESGHHADRFRTVEASIVPLTITSHLRKDGHAQIHFDASQNRSLTVREAARIQTFPDDYYFEGPQGWQFQQVGNAVPAFLAKQIALHVLKVMKEKNIFKE